MNKKQQGFTLVELSIVLVIIGLILGMAFKGRDLIDGAKARNIQAAQNKIQAGINTYFERYGQLPGDGCTAAYVSRTVAGAAGATVCPAGVRNGALDNAFEAASAINVLLNTNILNGNDIRNPFGGEWALQVGAGGNLPGNPTANGIVWMIPAALPAAPAANAAPVPATIDSRLVCRVDQLADDSSARAGNVRTNLAVGAYTSATDCWALVPPAAGASFGMRILP